ncbi:lipid II flippase MurJ [Tianweitania sediminis]|uniref:Virulence factor MviN n=1 Tax=Tianweitania sediminis TaxID=1502156 RepID=A0A8J7UK85_9HYPH|nr:lipid II flippase MurJ [Tianweitania sediminis]MBP0439620.1 virulence factor MviN [Tianweitania sediminis]
MTALPPEKLELAAMRPKSAMAFFLMGGALAGKALGFLREIAMAQVIGVAVVADGFRAATTAVLLPLAFLQNESVPGILIPMMKEGQTRGDGPRQLARLSLSLTSIGALLMIAMLLFGDFLVDTMVGGFSPQARDLTLHFVHIMCLSMPASVLLNCLAAGEMAIGRTRIMNLRASILNISILVGLGLLVLTQYDFVLGWAFAAAFNLLGAWATWRLVAEGNLSFSGITGAQVVATGMEFLRRLRPFLLLPGAEQAHVWLERLFASRAAAGAVASLDYARTLSDSALLLLSQPIGMAVLAGNGQYDNKVQAQKIARPILAVAIPFAAFTFLFAEDVVRLIFQRGAFDEHGVALTSQALSGIALGMWASTLGWVLLRLLNRSGRNMAAAIVLMSAYAANISFNVVAQTFGPVGDPRIFMIGLGETARSGVLLLGVALALGCSIAILRLILVALLPTALLVLVAWPLTDVVPSVVGRLAVGGTAWLCCTIMAGWLLCPDLLKLVGKRLVSFERKKR